MKKKAKKQAKQTQKPAQKKSKIMPLADRVLVRPLSEREAKGEKNDYGIILPDEVSKERSAQGEVLAVGEGKYIDGKLVPVRVKAGDKVVFSKYSYDEIEYGGEEYYLIKEEGILAIIS